MRSCIALLLIVVICLPLGAQTVTVVQKTVPYLGSTYYSHQRKVARTSTDILVVAWATGTTAGSQVQYSTYDKDFQTWSPPVALSSAPSTGWAIQPALAADDQGNIHATWQQQATSTDKYQIYYAKFNGVSWSTPKQVSVASSVRGEEATVEVDSKGYVWVVYNNDGEGAGKEFVYVVRSTDGGTTWGSKADSISTGGALGSSIEVARVALAAGPNGRLVAAWDNSQTGTNARREVYVNQYDGSTWGTPARISDTTAVDRDHNRYVAAALDGQSNIYVFYTLGISSASDPRLSYIVFHKKAWSGLWTPQYTKALDSSTVNYFTGGAVVDSLDVIHFAYRRDMATDTTGMNEIVYQFSKNGGSSWSVPTVLSRRSYDANYVTIANRVRRKAGIDIAWKESQDSLAIDQNPNSVLYGNVPYSFVTDVAEVAIPASFETLANYPNPFNPSTTISFDVAAKGRVTLVVFDLLGREVRSLVNEELEAGHHEVRWDGRTRAQASAPSGVYIARLTTASGTRTNSMLLLK